MPLQSNLANQKAGICLLSLDAGGTQSISQLKILVELMHRLSFGVMDEERKQPCNSFDMIGGVGSGGFIAILLVILGMRSDQALEEYIDLSASILEKQYTDAETRTTALRQYISRLLEKHGIKQDALLMDQCDQSKHCKLIVPISYKRNIGSKCILRNFNSRQGQAITITIAEAMLATLATPPLFTSTPIFKDSAAFEYVGADITTSNPITELIAEAYECFGSEQPIACILSVGCGHPGVLSSPEGSDLAKWNEFLGTIIKDSEQKAQSIDAQMGHLGLYYRFRVSRGLEQGSHASLNSGEIIAHTTAYLADVSISRKVDTCVDSLKLKDGVASLGQLKHSGGQRILPPTLPMPTRTFVMRNEPWGFLEKALLDEEHEIGRQRMLAVTGIGGCGKTQLMLKFMQIHKNKFISSFLVDGSSESRIRADILRHVRSLGTMYSQMGFEECLLFLGQAPSHGRRIIVYDNVDDPDVDITHLIPDGDGCAVALTSRNRSLSELCPDAHLELDKMSMDEAVELLLYTPSPARPISGELLEDTKAIARALDCLPIALQQSRSYMHETRCSARAYLERLRTSRDKLLARPVSYRRDMRYLSTYAAFEASFEKVDQRAQRWLRLLSYFYWSQFPIELVMMAAKRNFSEYDYKYVAQGDKYHEGGAVLKELFLQGGQWDAINLDELIVSLQRYSLVTLSPGVDTMLLEMHPLLHEWVRSCIPEQEKSSYQSAAIVLLSFGASEDYTTCTQYLVSHATHLSPLWGELHVNESAAFARILRKGGLYADSLQVQERIVKGLRGLADLPPATLPLAIGHLGQIYYDFGRFTEALEAQEEVVELKKKQFGAKDLTTLKSSSILSNTYYALGRYADALVLDEEVLSMHKEAMGERDSTTLMMSNNLATNYARMGRYSEALALHGEVLGLRKEILGGKHPATISSMGNIAGVYVSLGRYEEALVLGEEALMLRREIFGERHPITCKSMVNLAKTYEALGRGAEALELLEKAGPILLERLGLVNKHYKRCERIRSRIQAADVTHSSVPPSAIAVADSSVVGAAADS